ncbi:MAG: hypothetical protein ABJD97_03675 [Betaproteobacteria bacterium]
MTLQTSHQSTTLADGRIVKVSDAPKSQPSMRTLNSNELRVVAGGPEIRNGGLVVVSSISTGG